MNIHSITKLELYSNSLKRIGKQSFLEVKKNPSIKNIQDLKLQTITNDVVQLSNTPTKISPKIINRVSGKIIPTEISKIKKDNKIYFNLRTKDGKTLGYSTLEYPQKGYFKTSMGDDYIYNSMELTTLETINKGNSLSPYKGIGTELIKAAVKESKRLGYNGRIHLMAYDAKPPTPFYYKCGLRFVDEDKNKLMETFIKTTGSRLDPKIQYGLMYLPEENIEKLL